jgi:general L-amino acid transport system permease protein
MSFVATDRIAPRPPPAAAQGFGAWLRREYFPNAVSSGVTVALAALALWAAWHFLSWAVVNAVFSTHGVGAEACRVAGAGACWAVATDKLRLIVFGIYPRAEQWRPFVAMVLLLALCIGSTRPRAWNRWLAVAWGAGVLAIGLLMWGGLAGLPRVPDDQWGGLPVTLILATLGLAAGFPLAVLLALARHSRKPTAAKAMAVAFIEVTRSVPLLVVLFLASVMIPLFLPAGMELSKLFRVFVAFALFIAAYLAEVIRGGLLAIPKGQYEAAAALGLAPWVTSLKVILPQVLAMVLPALVNVFIAFFKATSIVVVVGIFDLMTAAKRAVADPLWQGFGTEIYLVVGAMYFVFCHAMSRYSAHLRRTMHPVHRG